MSMNDIRDSAVQRWRRCTVVCRRRR